MRRSTTVRFTSPLVVILVAVACEAKRARPEAGPEAGAERVSADDLTSWLETSPVAAEIAAAARAEGLLAEAEPQTEQLAVVMRGLARCSRTSGSRPRRSWNDSVIGPSVRNIGRIVVPVLIVVGDRPIFDPGVFDALAAILPDARVEVIEDTGHVPFLEAPDRFAEVVEAFLSVTSAR